MKFPLALILCCFLVLLSSAKVLEITEKNMPNVLKTLSSIVILYHHPNCQYSTNYKQKFTNFYHSNPEVSSQTVGIIDCSQQKYLCSKYNLTSYPAIAQNFLQGKIKWINADQYLAQLSEDYKKSDENLVNQILTKLKEKPNFVVVLFEQQGMPVLQSSRVKLTKYQDRIFYLSNGRTTQTLQGFVNNRGGCWIYELQTGESGQIITYNCGNTYQSSSQLKTTIQKYLNQSMLPTVFDNSEFVNETILGYKQMKYWLQHYESQLDASKNKKISVCNYLYLWSPFCQHCDYEGDMSILKKNINKAYKQKSQTSVSYKNQVNSFDIQSNQNILLSSSQLSKLMNLDEKYIRSPFSEKVEGIKMRLIPNLVSICFNTYDNTKMPESLIIEIQSFDHIFGLQNVRKFVELTLENTDKHLNSQSKIQSDEL